MKPELGHVDFWLNRKEGILRLLTGTYYGVVLALRWVWALPHVLSHTRVIPVASKLETVLKLFAIASCTPLR